MAVIRAVSEGEFDFGLVYQDFFDELTTRTSNTVTAFERSDERVAFHSLLLNPAYVESADMLRDALLAMHRSDKGKGVMETLDITQWLGVENELVERMYELQKAAA